jgi:predicted dehydrogenase
MSKVRVIVVGCGYIAQAQHLPNWMRSASAELAGVVDTRPELLAKVARSLGVPGYATLTDALANDRAELVHIATPASTHVALIDQAIAADRHVLVEKPLTEDLVDAERVSKNTNIAVGYPRMFDPDVRWLLAAASSGRFGALKAVATVWKMSLPATYTPIAEWPRTTRFTHPNGSVEQLRFRLFDESVHHIHLARSLTGGELQIRDVQPSQDAWMLFMTSGGVPVTHLNAGPSAHGEEITTYFEEAMVTTRPHSSHFPGIGGETIVACRNGDVLRPRIERLDAYRVMVEAVVEVVRGEGERQRAGRRGSAGAVWPVALSSAVDDIRIIHDIIDTFAKSQGTAL